VCLFRVDDDDRERVGKLGMQETSSLASGKPLAATTNKNLSVQLFDVLHSRNKTVGKEDKTKTKQRRAHGCRSVDWDCTLVRESIGEHLHFILRRQSRRRWMVWENLDLARFNVFHSRNKTVGTEERD
jgi:hypothetical protein